MSHSGDFGTFVIDTQGLNDPPSAERQTELASRAELSRDDFEELTGIQPEKNPETGRFEIGLYVIDDNGLRPKWAREETLEWKLSERRLVENQELNFPCTPHQLVAFMNGGGFDGSLFNVLPEVFRDAVTRETIAMPVQPTTGHEEQETWKSLWWATEYGDLYDLAQDFGSRLVNEGKKPSKNAIINMIVNHINQREKRSAGVSKKPRTISRTRLMEGPFKVWKYKGDQSAD